jgi:4-oxalomesaconate hydratase
MARRLQVIGAHSADFVWRAGGAIAACTAAGGTAEVIALSYGERGESGELWKQEGQTVDNVKEIRHGEAERAAGHLGASFRCLDLGDYPLQIDGDALLAIADVIREFAPDVVVTHTDTDPFNPDHPVAYGAVDRARGLAAGAGVSSAFATIRPPALFLFEPHQPELCNFTPTTFVDITAVMERKRAAMAEMKAQAYLRTYYDQRADHRGNHARLGDPGGPPGGGVPAGHPAGGGGAVMDELARLGVATVYEASGRQGLIDADLVQVLPGSRAAGPARPVRCGQGDNVTVHAAIAAAQPGEVLVLTMPEPAPVALVGDLLATQAKQQGVAAILVDAAVRDVEELRELGLPIWARWVRVRGAAKDVAGTIGEPVTVGGAEVRAGDVVVLDADGAAVVAADRVDEVLEAALAREEKERVKRGRLQAGELSWEIDGLRERFG